MGPEPSKADLLDLAYALDSFMNFDFDKKKKHLEQSRKIMGNTLEQMEKLSGKMKEFMETSAKIFELKIEVGNEENPKQEMADQEKTSANSEKKEIQEEKPKQTKKPIPVKKSEWDEDPANQKKAKKTSKKSKVPKKKNQNETIKKVNWGKINEKNWR